MRYYAVKNGLAVLGPFINPHRLAYVIKHYYNDSMTIIDQNGNIINVKPQPGISRVIVKSFVNDPVPHDPGIFTAIYQ